MSILSSFYHGEIRDCPNAAHNQPTGHPQSAAQLDAASAAMGPHPVQTPDALSRDCRCHPRACGCAPCKTRQEARRAAQSLNCVPGSRALFEAQLCSSLEPGLYYTQQCGEPCPEGWVETPHTVASKLEEREEFPRG